MSPRSDDGFEAVIELLTRLAVGDYTARGRRQGVDENLDAVIVGINMLAEELAAHHSELEQRVSTRTVELEAAREEAMAATRLKSQFLATMSHEIRTPMNGVIGLTELLSHTPLDDTQRRYVEGLRNAGEALLNVIDDILDFSKLEAGMVKLDVVDFDPQALVESVVGLLAATSPRANVELIAYCRPDVPRVLVGDVGRLRQVLINLTSNAVKFTEQGEVVLTVAVVAPTDGPCRRVRFEVADTGIGIAEHAQSALFDAFTQADVSTTRRYGGTGLGLAISRRLVETMGGVIGLESRTGAGTTFWFEVPFEVGSDGSPDRWDTTAVRGARALVVDANATHRRLLKARLSEWGMRPDLVETTRDVFARMREARGAGDPYAVALLEMYLPDGDGLDVARGIANDPELAGTPVLMLASDNQMDRAAVRHAGVTEWIDKPLKAADLLARLARLVSRSPAPPSSRAPEAPTGGAGPLGRVLIVEDNPVNQLVARGLVTSLGYEVEIADNGRQALGAVTTTAYDAVLMDCHMPVMDGYTATESLRRREGAGGRLPVIAMTAGATTEDRDRCLAAGMDDYIAKPVGREALREVLARWTGRRAPEPSLAAADSDAPCEDQVIDRDRLLVLAQLRGRAGTELLPALVEAFGQDAPALRVRIERAAERGDSGAMRRAAHELSGMAANLGAIRVTELARRIENATEGDDHRDLPAPLALEIQHALRVLRDAVTPK